MKIPFKYLFIIISIAGVIFFNYYFCIYAVNLGNHNYSADFSVMTYNINYYENKAEYDYRFKLLMKVIRDEDPDVLCLQEISVGNFKWMSDSLDAIFGYNDCFGNKEDIFRYVIYSKKPLEKFSQHFCDNDLSNYGFSDDILQEYNPETDQLPFYSAEIEILPNKWITVYSFHLCSSAYSNARKEMGSNESWFEGIPLYYRNYCIGKKIRDYEADNVRRHIDSIQSLGRPVIVAGDFNDWGGSYCMNTIEGETLKDAWWEGGNGFGWTYFGWNLRLRLDHILYSDELELVDVKVIDTDISDHKPLMAKFRFKE